MKTKRRLLLVAGTAGIVMAATVLVAFARFSATEPSQSDKFTAGTVTLSTSAVSTCAVSQMLPGAAPSPCQLKSTYTGTASAYLGLDVLIATKSGSPGSIALYNPSDSTKDLQITISDNQGSPVTYVSPSTSFGTALVSCPAGSGFDSSYTCYQLTKLLVSTTPSTSLSGPDTFTTTVTLPSNNPSGYQGGTASIALTVHAAQSAHQSLAGCAAGNACTSITWS
jgi:hypothetical protein